MPVAIATNVTVERTQTFEGKCAEAAFLRSGEAAMRSAISDCTAAINIKSFSDARRGNIYYNRGYIYFHLAEYKAAENDFTRAIDLGMNHSYKAFYARGLCKQNTERYRAAAYDFEEARQIRPDWQWAIEKRREFWWVFDDEYPYDN